jgi:uncharacterized protein (TIRG00374 family)
MLSPTTHSRSIALRRWIDRRHLLYMAILAVAIFLLLPRLIGFDRVLRVLRAAEPTFLALALAAESVRYLMSAASTRVLARLFGRGVPFFPMVEAFFAGAALNRTFSTGGAPGMIVRFIFLAKQGVSAGGVAAIFLIEDVIGLAIGSIAFLVGVATLTTAQADGLVAKLAIGFMLGSLLLVLGGFYILRNHAGFERIVHALARSADAITRKLFRRTLYQSDRVQRTLDDFYAGLEAARRAPHLVAASFLYNAIRYAAGALTLYFTLHALDQAIAPGVLILFYTTASVLSTASAVPGEVAIMGTGFAILFLSLGIPREVALLALILARALAFWLPLAVGYAMLWDMRRRHYL